MRLLLSHVTFTFISVKKATLRIPDGIGCGGWCAKVVIIRNGKIDCASESAPSNCETEGFRAGHYLVASFGNDCTALDADADNDKIKFRLYTPVGGSHSDWCVDEVKIEASNGTKTKTFQTPGVWVSEHRVVVDGSDRFHGWVGQGDWAREHWAYNYDYIYPGCCPS